MWPFIALFVASFIVSYLMAPKPQTQKPPGIGEVETPTAEEGREISVLFGTRDINSANNVWFGNVKTVAIKKKGGKK